MGVQVKEVKKEALRIPYFMLLNLSGLIGKFKCSTYEDFEFIQKKKELLNQHHQVFSQKVQEDPSKAQEVWQSESELSKADFAWLPKDVFKALIIDMKLNVDEIGVLQFWVVKD